MVLLLLLLIPFVTALGLLLFRPDRAARTIAFASSVLVAALAVVLWAQYPGGTVTAIDHAWLPQWGLHILLGYDGVGLLMVLLTALLYPFILVADRSGKLADPAKVNALLLFTQSFLLGVFTAQNAFLFYVFYELSLIPVFFLLLFWGGAGRRAITLRFFIYTLLGGLALLFGLAYLVVHEPTHSADFTALAAMQLPGDVQIWLFWALFLPFAVKLPIFPFHGWQPSTYVAAPLQGTLVLAAIMLKMGLYGALKFVFPIVPVGVEFWRSTVIGLSLFGAIYAAVIAFRQQDLKRLVAYSSLSHVGVLTAGLFAWNTFGVSGAFYQAFAHAVLVVSLFYMVGGVQDRTGTLRLDELGGLKHKAPRLAALLLFVTANAIGLPLTQSFIGEWLMFNGLWQNDPWAAFAALTTIVLGAIYMLYAYQRVMLGPERPLAIREADAYDHAYLVPLIALTLLLGAYPAPVLELVNDTVLSLFNPNPALP